MSSSDLIAANQAALQRLLRQAGIRAKRENGQNFLIDGVIVEDLVATAKIVPGDLVLEIGPGLGAVSDVLIEQGAKVIAVELDEKLALYLKKKYSGDDRITVVHGDILKLVLADYVTDGAYKLVSSLPFNITSLVLRTFLEQSPRPTEIALLIQSEVARRVVAPPGEMSMLSVSVQYLGQPSIVRTVSSECFFPKPDVDGAIIHISVRPLPEKVERSNFFRTVRIGYSARRKMLANNLQAGFRLSREKTQQILQQSRIEPTARAQELSVENWQELVKNIV